MILLKDYLMLMVNVNVKMEVMIMVLIKFVLIVIKIVKLAPVWPTLNVYLVLNNHSELLLQMDHVNVKHHISKQLLLDLYVPLVIIHALLAPLNMNVILVIQ